MKYKKACGYSTFFPLPKMRRRANEETGPSSQKNLFIKRAINQNTN